MARTNLFKPLTNPTGNFYMFQQYADDLTRESSQKNTYKVIPSKFAAVELDAQALLGLEADPSNPDVNASICSYLQRSYENACAFFKSDNAYDTVWNNNGGEFMASRLLWQNLLMYRFMHLQSVVNDGVTQQVCPEIKYVGDINIYTNKEYDGIMYNEIYCYIPTDAKESLYYMTCTDSSRAGVTPQSFNYGDSTLKLVGWNDDNYPSNLSQRVPNSALFGYDDDGTTPRGDKYFIRDSWWVYPQALSYSETEADDSSASQPVTSDSFKINAIILFYDVYDSVSDNYRFKNLPLGIYFTGTHNNNTPAEFSNTILKYVNNDDVYGQGTSYGLRVLTKYVCTPNSLFYIDSVFEVDDMYPEYYKLMEEMAETVEAANLTIDSNRAFHQDIKDHLALFKNYRTNVPYIRYVNGVPYWFVNGRNTGQAAVTDAEDYATIINDIAHLNECCGEVGDDIAEVNEQIRVINQWIEDHPGGGADPTTLAQSIRIRLIDPFMHNNPDDPWYFSMNDSFLNDGSNPYMGSFIPYWEVMGESDWEPTEEHAIFQEQIPLRHDLL